VRFKMTNKREVAVLPRKDYQALAVKAQETGEDFGTARLVARARREITAGVPLIPKEVVDKLTSIAVSWNEAGQLDAARGHFE
jgi:hypothetical protein